MQNNQKFIEFQNLLEQAARFRRPKREKTVFSIGGRGHYENPVTDVLSFFMDPREEHGFNTLFLSSLLETLNMDSGSIEEGAVELVEREVVTESGNRMDLVIATDKQVFIIENKIYHGLFNPLEDYENYVKRNFPGKEPIFIILSINKVGDRRENWKNILYADLIQELKSQSGPYMFNSNNAKWSFFLKDFILNIEELIGEHKVDKEMIDFVQQNYSKILELIDVKDNYITSLKKMFAELLPVETAVQDKVHNWGKRAAIRFYCPDKWKGQKNNLVLVVLPEGKFKIYYYVYGIETHLQDDENRKLILPEFTHWKENKGTILCYKTDQSFELDDAKEMFISAAKHLNQYFN